jgi:hypothetical protein
MKQLTWPAVALLAIIGAVVVALAALTGWGSGEIIAVAGILGGIGGGAAVAGTVSGRVEDVHTETTAQNQVLAKIDSQTNGQLASRDTRIAALEAQLRQLGGQP